jgi:hypothetical protein
MKNTSIKHLTFSHQACLRGLEFYQLELGFLQERLEEIAGDYTAREVAEQVEHFQNQLIIHREQIDNLKHRIHQNLDQLAAALKLSENFIRETTVTDAEKIAGDYHNEETLFKEMRQHFNRFAAQWM